MDSATQVALIEAAARMADFQAGSGSDKNVKFARAFRLHYRHLAATVYSVPLLTDKTQDLSETENALTGDNDD
jgi:hypothetical protein